MPFDARVIDCSNEAEFLTAAAADPAGIVTGAPRIVRKSRQGHLVEWIGYGPDRAIALEVPSLGLEASVVPRLRPTVATQFATRLLARVDVAHAVAGLSGPALDPKVVGAAREAVTRARRTGVSESTLLADAGTGGRDQDLFLTVCGDLLAWKGVQRPRLRQPTTPQD